MKLIVLDCLRRWGWVYLLGFVVAAGLNVVGSFFSPFGVFTPYFLAPMVGPLFVLGFDLMRGTAGVTIALPVAAREVGISYWIVGVCIPPVLLSLAVSLVAVVVSPFNPPNGPGWEQVGLTFLISFLICGCIFLILTGFKVGPQDGFWNNAVAGLCGALWGVSTFSPIGIKFLLDSGKAGPGMITALIGLGLLLTVLGFQRAGEVVQSRARNRITRQSTAQKPTRATPMTTPASGVSGLPYLFLESMKFALGMAVATIFFGLLIRAFLPVSTMFIQYMLLLCALLPSLRHMPSLRQMRTLPISLDGLALTLFLLPVINFGLCLGILLLADATVVPDFLKATPATLLFTGSISLLGHSIVVRLGPKSLPVCFMIGITLFACLPMRSFSGLPVVAHFTLNGALLVAAFGMLRSSLRSGNLYRLPAAALQGT
jgi:hypothetical protein